MGRQTSAGWGNVPKSLARWRYTAAAFFVGVIFRVSITKKQVEL